MKHLRAEQRHDVVVQLGELAERLNLKHKRIVVNLRESRRRDSASQSIDRAQGT